MHLRMVSLILQVEVASRDGESLQVESLRVFSPPEWVLVEILIEEHLSLSL